MNIPCSTDRNYCLDPAEAIANLSSEAPDSDFFISLKWGVPSPLFGPLLGSAWGDSEGGGGGCTPADTARLESDCAGESTVAPPLGDSDRCGAGGGLVIGHSAESQAAADLCDTQKAIQRSAFRSQVWKPFIDPKTGQTRYRRRPRTLFGNTPQSCVATCPDGSALEYILASNTVYAYEQALADDWARSIACERAFNNLACLGVLADPNACLLEEYNETVSVFGSYPPYTFEVISGVLPTGTDLQQSTPNSVKITGTPNTTGNFTFRIKAVDSRGNVNSREYTIAVMGFNPGSMPDASIGAPYTFQFTATGGALPHTFALGPDSQALPNGLSMDSSGLVTGTPNNTIIPPQTFVLKVQVTDAHNQFCEKEFDLTVNAFGYFIKDWSNVRAQLAPGPACGGSAKPEWDGFFNLQTTWSTNFPMWYFIGKSLLGKAVAADEAPDYPNGDWQNDDCVTQIYWDGSVWNLWIVCDDCGLFWLGQGGNGLSDPSGPYVRSSGSGPGNICVGGGPGAQLCRMRIKNYTTGLLSPCGNCDATGNPAWDGTFPNFSLLNYATDANKSVGGKVMSGGGIHNTGPWFLSISCFDTVDGSVQKAIWAGFGPALSPVGIYTLSFSDCGGQPATIEVESY